MTQDRLPPPPKAATRTDSVLTQDDREWFAELLFKSEERMNGKISTMGRELHDKIDSVQRQTSSVDLEHAAALNHILLASSRDAGREGSEASGKKWAAIQAVIALIVTLITTMIAHQSTPAAVPEKQKTPTVQTQAAQ